jgi:hypothetical protein
MLQVVTKIHCNHQQYAEPHRQSPRGFWGDTIDCIDPGSVEEKLTHVVSIILNFQPLIKTHDGDAVTIVGRTKKLGHRTSGR